MLFMVTTTLPFPVEETVADLEVCTAGNEETPAGRSFRSPVNCGKVKERRTKHFMSHR